MATPRHGARYPLRLLWVWRLRERGPPAPGQTGTPIPRGRGWDGWAVPRWPALGLRHGPGPAGRRVRRALDNGCAPRPTVVATRVESPKTRSAGPRCGYSARSTAPLVRASASRTRRGLGYWTTGDAPAIAAHSAPPPRHQPSYAVAERRPSRHRPPRTRPKNYAHCAGPHTPRPGRCAHTSPTVARRPDATTATRSSPPVGWPRCRGPQATSPTAARHTRAVLVSTPRSRYFRSGSSLAPSAWFRVERSLNIRRKRGAAMTFLRVRLSSLARGRKKPVRQILGLRMTLRLCRY